MKGVYVLILRLDNDRDILVGKLGELHFKKGFYAYIGSAMGRGGFKRVTRHFNVAQGKNSTRKWHIDYLLPHSEVICAVFSPTCEAIECVVAKILGEKTLRKFYQTRGMLRIPQHCASRSFGFSSAILGFGCSDCSCETHLFFTGKNISGDAADACRGVSGNESIIINPHM
ncbi:MAG: GIY-YIG nuclease family protein [Candidatus Methanoperedens sp.]|nr:GIY-YIG nuclease family protein [Candidatus Methanoperedens sp.]